MFLRRCERRKNGKRHTYWALVESHRTVRGSRQRVVAYLGELAPSEQDGWAKLGAHLEGKDADKRPQRTLLDPPLACDRDEEAPVKVRLKDVRLGRLRDFGDVWLAWGLWRMLGLDSLLSRLLPEGREDVPWATVAAILAIARFCEPSSELHIEEKWYRRTALEELLGVVPEKVHTDRLYTALDRLLPHKAAIETHLKKRFGELFELKCDLLLYDVTSTYFEGDMEGCPIAKRGYSRDSRGDRPQVCIGLVVTEEGFPLGYEVFAGNTHDSKTVKSMIEALESKHGSLNRIWVMDRGMVSDANLEFLRERGAKYIVGTPKSMLRAFEKEIAEQNWVTAQEGVDVKLVKAPDGDETFLLARSVDRRSKELAMHEKFIANMEEGLVKLKAAAESGRLRDEAIAGQRLGRLMERFWRASRAFDVTIAKLARPIGKQHLEVSWSRNATFHEWSQLADGCYLLRTNLTDEDPATLWRRYIQLTEAEWAFRIAKDELAIRPVWHQKENRVRAHVLVCFLAYAMWKTLAGWMQGAGLGDAPRTVIYELAKIKSGDIVLAAESTHGIHANVRLRHVTEPEAEQKALLNRLGLTLPRRLKRIDKVVEPM
jgi:transposase